MQLFMLMSISQGVAEVSQVPVTDDPFINWLLGFFFLSLVSIIVWLALQVTKSLGTIKDAIDSMSKTIVKLETEMGQLKDDNTFLRNSVSGNTASISTLNSDMARVLEWKKQTEKL